MSPSPARRRDPDLDRRRTAALLFDAELQGGRLDPAALQARAVRSATRVAPIPPRPVCLAQQVLYKLGRSAYERAVCGPLLGARRAALGAHGAAAPPRLLVRVDEFPHFRAWDEPRRFGTEAFERFHEIMAGAGVPYLIAALPRVSREPLRPAPLGSRPWDEGEVEMAARLAAEGVAFALHGLDHRTRHASPRRHSELSGLTDEQTEQLLDRASQELAGHGLKADVFVAPYNRFDAGQLGLLARRFAVVCGGPESIGTLGFQRPGQWRGETVYLPAYAPFYGRAEELLPAVERAVAQETGLWTPVVLHWGWEAQDGWGSLERLARAMAGQAVHWDEFLGAVRRSLGDDAE